MIMFEYRKIKHDDSILNMMGKDDWELVQILWEVSYWKRKIIATRTKKDKVEFKEELFYNKKFIKWCCDYVFDEDFKTAYEEWREQRRLSPSYKTCYNESSEKRTFNKLVWKPKQIALKMLENASAQKRLILYDLDQRESEEIISKLRNENHKIEVKQQWFTSEQELKQAQEDKNKLNEYIDNNPRVREEAKEYVNETYPWTEWVYRETLIMARARIIAKKLIKE